MNIYILFNSNNSPSSIYYRYKSFYNELIFSILRLCGFPFLVSYYSKDLIIEYFFF